MPLPSPITQGTTPSPLALRLEQVKRRQAIADALQAQGLAPPGEAGQMVSGHFVSNALPQAVQRIVSMLLANKMTKGNQEEGAKLYEEQTAVEKTAIDAFRAGMADPARNKRDVVMEALANPATVESAKTLLGKSTEELNQTNILPGSDKRPAAAVTWQGGAPQAAEIPGQPKPQQEHWTQLPRERVNGVEIPVQQEETTGKRDYGPHPQQPISVIAANNAGQTEVDQIALYIRQHNAPPPGLGRNPVLVQRGYARAGEMALAEGGSLEAEALNRLKNENSQKALKELTARTTQLEVNAGSAERNMKTVERLATMVDRTGSPLINKLKQAWSTSVIQDPNLAALRNAVTETTTEYAKVVTGQTTGQAVTDHANQQAQRLLSISDNPEAFAAELTTMREFINNRRSESEAQKQSLLMGMQGSNAGQQPATKPPPSIKPLAPSTDHLSDEELLKLYPP